MKLPQQIGRKKSMTPVLLLYLVASNLTVYGGSLSLKKIGFFIQGLLHIKITLSYTHLLEMVPDDASKAICSTVVNAFDAVTLGIQGFVYMYVVADAVKFIEFMNIVGTIAILSYILIVPESPKWLFLNGQRKEAIKNLNYIAKLNGSSTKIP